MNKENTNLLNEKIEGKIENKYKAYYFEVGVEDNEGLDRQVPYFEIPYETMDENVGMCQTFSEAFDYVDNYIKNGVTTTYGIIVEVDVDEKTYNSIYDGWSDSYNYYNMKEGKLRYSAYKDKTGRYVVAFDDTNDIKLGEGKQRKTLGEHIVVEDKECLKEETLTWEDIMTNAEGTTFGQQSLKVKDTAMDNIEQLLVKAGIDIDNVENVEDEIEKYCKDNNIKFDTHGNIITECDKVTEDVVSFDEAFYEKICRAYIDTMNLEWVTTNPENYDSVVHGYFANDDVAEKWEYGAKVTPENFKDAAYDGYTQEEAEELDVDWYEYDTWLDFYEDIVKSNIDYDIDDIGVYDFNDNWDFYISEEDLTKLGLWNGNIKSEFLDESKKVTENISFDNIMDYRELIDSDNGDLVDTFFFDHKLTEEEDKAIIEAINKAKSEVEDYDNYTVMEYINKIVPIKQSLSTIYSELGSSTKKQIKY